MTKWHVAVEIKATHHFTIEADDAIQAQTTAMDQLTQHDAERWETTIEVERGVG